MLCYAVKLSNHGLPRNSTSITRLPMFSKSTLNLNSAFCVAHSLGKISLQRGQKYQHTGSIHKCQYKFGFLSLSKIYFRFLNFYTYKCSARVAGSCGGHESVDSWTWSY